VYAVVIVVDEAYGVVSVVVVVVVDGACVVVVDGAYVVVVDGAYVVVVDGACVVVAGGDDVTVVVVVVAYGYLYYYNHYKPVVEVVVDMHWQMAIVVRSVVSLYSMIVVTFESDRVAVVVAVARDALLASFGVVVVVVACEASLFALVVDYYTSVVIVVEVSLFVGLKRNRAALWANTCHAIVVSLAWALASVVWLKWMMVVVVVVAVVKRRRQRVVAVVEASLGC
jgi:hypothetical protein